MNISIRSLLFLGAGASLALFSGCATTAPTATSHPDAMVAYADYKTFAMLRPSTFGMGNPAATPTLVRQARQDTEAAFLAKGLTKARDAEADLFVLVHGGVSEKIDVKDWGLSYGRFGYGYVGRQELTPYKEGSLSIDVFDAKTRVMIWRGTIASEITDAPTPDRVKSAIDAIVARYPN